jgi:cytochrome c oxidase assembly protein subunit 15
MITTEREKWNRQVANWLLLGVAMIIIQVLIGGITRLTESGLSITEWKPITGTLPPLNDADWQIEFDKYRNTDQFKYVHQHFSMQEFKFIFFWEWFHRVWARLIGIVFLIGFVYFLVTRKLSRKMLVPFILLFFLGGIQGAIGWIMVKSGLVPEKFYVGHIELTTHFIAALLLLAFTLWFALKLNPTFEKKVYNTNLRKLLLFITVCFFIQLIYGGFMAGLKAAASAPTWPTINGQWLPKSFNELSPFWKNLVNNKLTIHFIHRALAYVLLAAILYFYLKSRNIAGTKTFSAARQAIIVLVAVQVLLGILALINATQPAFVWIGVLHQFTAMLLLICITVLWFVLRKDKMMAG